MKFFSLCLLVTLFFSTKVFAIPMVENLDPANDIFYEYGHEPTPLYGEMVVFKPTSNFLIENVELPIFFQPWDTGYRSFLLDLTIYKLSDPNPNNSSSFERIWGSHVSYSDNSPEPVPLSYPTNESLINFTSSDSSTLFAESYYCLSLFPEPNNIGHIQWQFSNQTPYQTWTLDEFDPTSSWEINDTLNYGFRINGEPIPEPSTLILLACGILGFIGRKQKM